MAFAVGRGLMCTDAVLKAETSEGGGISQRPMFHQHGKLIFCDAEADVLRRYFQVHEVDFPIEMVC